ncbi:rhomboid family intramembrane serine protease [Halioglobus maricola]|uniref:Rhomboid family intramembrane serine protease n=1 Tax=Halioglobus maricola TaxID=2601894 RepID=A0A5P9NKN0_9GAMM|nr:rhomboid family intramembrane serine protease [Halioglobus maricola]QFU76400.1 rhomboid family intramembrane serine protease [Halioglobus maricola]
MADTFDVLDVSVEEDLLPLTALLRSRGVPHRIYEEEGRQILTVFAENNVAPVRELYRAWRAEEVTISVERGNRVQARAPSINWRQGPVTAVFAVIAIVVFLLIDVAGMQGLIPWLTFLPVDIVAGQIVFYEMGQQYWRLISPIFLHFGWLHIIFNCLWVWEFGRRTERVLGPVNQIGLILAIALVSNCLQYFSSGPSIFGGLSGVVYGLLGFAWVAPLLQSRWDIQPPPAIMVFMVGWLVAGYLGVLEGLGMGSIANAAHLGGLLAGAALGALLGVLARRA